MKKDKCKSCQADILWVKTPKGNFQPLDLPSKKGTVLRAGMAVVVDVYMPHHATCPYAAQHRKG